MRPALCPASPSRQATESVAVSEQGLAVLPPGIEVIERGWLSANNVLLFDGNEATLVDSGYVSHAAQTVALVGGALAGRRLARRLRRPLREVEPLPLSSRRVALASLLALAARGDR